VIPAAPDQCDVPDVQLEGVPLAYPVHEHVEFLGRNVVDTAALLAHEMAVRAREMEERRTVRLVHVLDEPPGVQGVKGPVDGRQMDLGMRVMHARRQVVGGEMFARAREQLDHEPPGGCDAPTFGAQRVEGSRFLLGHARLPFLGALAVQLQGVRIWFEVWI
jgi:hypothetical protein